MSSWIRMISVACVLALPATTTRAEPDAPLPRAAPETVGLSPDRLKRIGDAIKIEINQGRLPGAVIAIARRGKLAYLEVFGYRDPTSKAPMTPDALFSIASMTKPMVSVGIMMLVEEGKILLSDPVGKHLPQLANLRVAERGGRRSDGDEIVTREPKRQPTIQDLLRHTSGMTSGNRGTTAVHKAWPNSGAWAATHMTGAEFLNTVAKLPLLHEPGTVWSYGFSTDVLGQVIEAVAGKSLSAFLAERLWQPLAMSDTSFVVPDSKRERYARAFANSPLTGKPQSVLHSRTMPLQFECGGGCGVSTAGDYIRFTQMLLNGGVLDGKRVLGRKTVTYMTSDHLGPEFEVNAEGASAGYGFGLGFAVRRQAGVARVPGSVGDYNWGGAYGTYFWNDPQEELTTVFMSQAPGPIRYHYRQLLTSLVLQTLVD